MSVILGLIAAGAAAAIALLALAIWATVVWINWKEEGDGDDGE